MQVSTNVSIVLEPFKPWYENTYSFFLFSPYISYGTSKENLSKNQYLYLGEHFLYSHHLNVWASNDYHRRPKLKIRDVRHKRDSSVSAYKVVLCYNGLNLNYKGLYGKTMDLFSIVEIIVVWK